MKPNVGGRPLSLKSCLEEIGTDQPLRASLIRRGYDIASIAPARKGAAK